ncbi:ABC transporter family substrate-binding protein [Corynebacterium vitaeruminis]|nr:ABC transporter family substrate-binding protein [Corynebacterium vitaeruminis]
MRVCSSRLAAAACLVSAVLLASCSANPGPAPVEEDNASAEATTSEAPAEKNSKLTEINIGIDPIAAGFNPHLAGDDSAFTRELASLVLPSAFVDGAMNRDLLTAADAIAPQHDAQGNPYAMTIRYQIRSEAQWSDGTPITVSDFEYLANQIVATPGAQESALYREIAAIRSANGGKTVEVDLKDKVANWQQLFANLLPAHLVRGQDFTKALESSVPASAGRYSVAKIDRQRGVVQLNRNDRFWGENPAAIEVLNFQEVRSVSQGVEMLSTGQVGFIDMTPTQTSHQAFDLVQGAQTREQDQPRELTVTANASLGVDKRRALLSSIDVPLLAKLATEREAEIQVGQALSPAAGAPGLKELFPDGIRIGVDPADPVAARAATTLTNMFVKAGVQVKDVETDTASLLRDYVATGGVDLVVGWEQRSDLSRYQCALDQGAAVVPTSEAAAPSTEATDSSAPASTTSSAADQKNSILGTNFSGWCDPASQAFIAQALAGEKSQADADAWAADLDKSEALRVWITRDTRLEVVGTSIVGPAPALADWPAGMSSVLTWRNNA